MHHSNSSCQHLETLDDFHEGSVVCTLCGLVISPLFSDFVPSIPCYQEEINSTESFCLNEIKNLLDRIHVSTCFATRILTHLRMNFTTNSRRNVVYSVFKVLNELNIPISLKEISHVSNLSKKTLHQVQSHNEVIDVDFSDVVEKYARLLNLSFETIALIKAKIKNSTGSGHNPNSVLASTIYQICKSTGQRISMKKIAQVTQVSCVSIQRYNKFIKDKQ